MHVLNMYFCIDNHNQSSLTQLDSMPASGMSRYITIRNHTREAGGDVGNGH